MRPHHWFFALILSALLHGWVIYSVNFFEYQQIEREVDELPFTVLLSDQETVEQLVLEDPEAASSDVIPLISLDEGDQNEIEAVEPAAEIAASGESLELIVSGDSTEMVAADSEEVALEDQPELSVAGEQMLNLLESADLTPPEQTSVPSLSNVAVLTPESVAQMSASMESVPAETLELSPESISSVETLPEMEELALVETVTDPAMTEEVPLMPEIAMPEAGNQSEVILAEITIEQIEFDEAIFKALPEVKAEEWSPELPSMSASQSQGWKRRYAGAKGIGAGYRKQMRATLTQFVLYPKAVAEEQGVEGKVVVGFTINREGRLEDTEILESSGHPALDQAVEKMVEFAQPFNQLPAGVKSDKVRFAFPVTIRLKR